MVRPREFLMQELREAQKALIAAKKRRNRESENYRVAGYAVDCLKNEIELRKLI